jgi:ethanolamine utilization protein EutQ
MKVEHYTSEDARFFQYLDKEIYVGDVLDPANSEHMSAGYYRNMKKGDRNEWVVTYDEVLVVTRGTLIVRTEGSVKTAKPGEIIFLKTGAQIAYEAGEDGTEAVYVSYPHWLNAQERSEHAHLLSAYHPVRQEGGAR